MCVCVCVCVCVCLQLVRIQRGRTSRLGDCFDDVGDALDLKVSPRMKTDDYYDSINANNQRASAKFSGQSLARNPSG